MLDNKKREKNLKIFPQNFFELANELFTKKNFLKFNTFKVLKSFLNFKSFQEFICCF